MYKAARQEHKEGLVAREEQGFPPFLNNETHNLDTDFKAKHWAEFYGSNSNVCAFANPDIAGNQMDPETLAGHPQEKHSCTRAQQAEEQTKQEAASGRSGQAHFAMGNGGGNVQSRTLLRNEC